MSWQKVMGKTIVNLSAGPADLDGSRLVRLELTGSMGSQISALLDWNDLGELAAELLARQKNMKEAP